MALFNPDEIIPEDATPKEREEKTKEIERWNQIVKDVTFPNTFAQLYLLRCYEIDDYPKHLKMYEDLDKGLALLRTDWENYKKALSTNRVCIALPAKLAQNQYGLNKEYFDTLGENNIPLYLASSPTEHLRASLINAMEGEQEIIFWKLQRLEKVSRLGWEGFVEQYN